MGTHSTQLGGQILYWISCVGCREEPYCDQPLTAYFMKVFCILTSCMQGYLISVSTRKVEVSCCIKNCRQAKILIVQMQFKLMKGRSKMSEITCMIDILLACTAPIQSLCAVVGLQIGQWQQPGSTAGLQGLMRLVLTAQIFRRSCLVTMGL